MRAINDHFETFGRVCSCSCTFEFLLSQRFSLLMLAIPHYLRARHKARTHKLLCPSVLHPLLPINKYSTPPNRTDSIDRPFVVCFGGKKIDGLQLVKLAIALHFAKQEGFMDVS